MTGITGGAASFDKRFGEIGNPVPFEANDPRNNTKDSQEDDKASGQTHITGVTLNKKHIKHLVVITNNPTSDDISVNMNITGVM
eukprot:13216550-Ditylum_brightwellii.AAC.1